ncbi:hypothetical protein RB213_010643 [Colletotrichum asianum]
MEDDCQPSRHHDRLAFLALTNKIRDWAQVHDHAVPHLLTPEDHRLIRACDRVDPHELALAKWKPGPAATDRMVRKRYRITIVGTGKCVFEVCPKWHRFIKPAVCNAAKQGQRAKNDNGNNGPSVKTRAHVPRKEQSEARPRAKARVKAARSLTSPRFMTSFKPYRDSTAEGRARKLTMTPAQAKAHVAQCASSTPEHQTTKLSKAAFWAKASRRPSDDMITGGPASRAEFAQMLQMRKKRSKCAKKSGRLEQEKRVQKAKVLRKKVAMKFA